MAKLSIATLEGMKRITRNRMRRGVLHVSLAPSPDSSTAGYQPPSSGRHSSRPDRPVLLRFPVEILKNILEYLEPIWLIQVASAYPDINKVLGFQQSNRIWYDALPAALFLEPESFQDEVLVENRKMAYTSGDGTDTTLQLSTNHFRNETFYYGSTRSSRFVLPVLLGLSELSLNLDFSYDTTHPHDRRFYPTTPTRVRVMALGGPYQPWLDYRREITGHLHYNMRCCICLELTGRYRRYKQIWGLKWCTKCYDHYMLDPAQVSKIPGLVMLIKRFAYVSSIRLREKPQNYEYRPMVDEILRARIGIDFETAVNVQCYILQLLQTWKGGPQCEQLRVNRSRLRGDIVKRAQEIWQSIKLKGNENFVEKTGDLAVRRLAIQKKIIVHARERWAPASVLPTFLFPSRLLTDADLWLPYDPDEQWLPDPTLQLETSRDVLRAGTGWVDQKAREMLLELVIYKPDMAISTWVKAAEQWHIQRITQDLYSGKYLNLEYGGHRLRRLENVGTPENNRLDVIAKKLRIDPLFPVGTLTEHENKMAVASFIRLIRHRCAGCPINNLLILPCGLKEIVQHFGQYHPYEFWLNDKWTVRG
ncbi:hypothetical protein EPUS_02428 [Endocarpon pusillum Z07020]|uniref:F-box domain-containing protein n=1 Tax=Endocarpon pusillum (strain Z07020 / HMAS-L-300199) TaxID=1263415 RepID=U1GGK3_ENDPU|nr:uncharacterized protein EPUS_02428 [Endocarpon pusillum Z07020]ERF70906.1 hypothetical protein EPUS_02428 [Endocarpon pusillum Z07020]